MFQRHMLSSPQGLCEQGQMQLDNIGTLQAWWPPYAQCYILNVYFSQKCSYFNMLMAKTNSMQCFSVWINGKATGGRPSTY
jgi:hypothetical protein